MPQNNPTVQNGRELRKLPRITIQDNVVCLDLDAGVNPEPSLYEFHLMHKHSDKGLEDCTGYDITELLIHKIKKNLDRNGNRDAHLNKLASVPIDVFGFEIVVEGSAGPAPFDALDDDDSQIALQVAWFPTSSDTVGPIIHAIASTGSDGPEALPVDPPSPVLGFPGTFFVGHQVSDSPDWTDILGTYGVDAGIAGGLLSGAGGLAESADGLLYDRPGWQYFGVDLTFSARIHGGQMLFTEECFKSTSYQHHPWLMGKLGLTNPPVKPNTVEPSSWDPPTHYFAENPRGKIAYWEPSYEHRSADDIEFDRQDFVEVDGTEFVDGNGTLRFHGGNHPELRFKSPQRITSWIDQWQSAVPKFNVLRVPAFGSGVPTGTDCLPLITGVDDSSELIYSEAAFRQLDEVVYQCGKHGIRLIMMLSNYRDWQGGISQWIEWYTDESDDAEKKHLFFSKDGLNDWYETHIDTVLNRTNHITRVKYKHDPTIMMWELCSEPRVEESQHEPGFTEWVNDMSTYLCKRWDTDNHRQLISVGGGDFMDPTDNQYYIEAHKKDNIDAWSTHLYPGPCHWKESQPGQAGIQCIKNHRQQAQSLGLPMYVGELGFCIIRGNSDSAARRRPRNEALTLWFSEIDKEITTTKNGFQVAGGLSWDTRLLEEYSTLREFERANIDDLRQAVPSDDDEPGWEPVDIYPSDSDTMQILREEF